jgi:putative aldouronate transport system permease protein
MQTTAKSSANFQPGRRQSLNKWRSQRNIPLYLMLLPAFIAMILFSYLPMFGIIMAFQNYKPLLGFVKSPFVGLANFQRMFTMPDFGSIFRNTLIIACGKLFGEQFFALVFALCLNEVKKAYIKGPVQTITYALYFLSWILFGGILLDILGSSGAVNNILGLVGIKPVGFLINPKIFPATLISTDVWKNFGMGAVLYLAALADVDPALNEAAAVDGANRWERMWNVTLPGILPTVVVLACLNLGSIMDAGMDQVLVLYNAAVYSTGDVIGTWVYRVGLVSGQYSLGAAVGLFQSVISFFMIVLSYYLAWRIAKYRIF